ncbi:MAG: NAD(P)H-hydrate epimerase [Sandaracinaceae bacterium]
MERIDESKIPFLSTEQMVEVDRAMIEDYAIILIQMMENAGRNLAHTARTRFLGGDPRGESVVVLAGTGGNGGGAMVCARRLHNWGADVAVVTSRPDEEMTEIPKHQLAILRRMDVPVFAAAQVGELRAPDLVVDGVIGYSLKGAPFGEAADLIRWANGTGAPILALDAPSGLDTTTGTVYEPAIRATATMTLALPKEGLKAGRDNVGELYLADISVPPGLYGNDALGMDLGPIFATGDVLKLVY